MAKQPVRDKDRGRSRQPSSSVQRPLVAGIGISHPDRMIFPELGISKIDFARYFETIAEWIVPHVSHRPLTLLHCPAGASKTCIFLKHAKAWGPMALHRVKIQEKTKVGEYLYADSMAGVVALAQMGIIEIHTWNATADDIERPNRIVWDLDPGPEVHWKDTVSTARRLRTVLQTLGLKSWAKTTGGRGLHVVVPMRRGPDWSAQCRSSRSSVRSGTAGQDARHDQAGCVNGRHRRGRAKRQGLEVRHL